jgi:hypothetical protein
MRGHGYAEPISTNLENRCYYRIFRKSTKTRHILYKKSLPNVKYFLSNSRPFLRKPRVPHPKPLPLRNEKNFLWGISVSNYQ